ncbi:MAG: DUF5706 domain-containing protein [Candidatus Pseudobacter hemicellulosilyticus]|uniref:DUF5706 domain-containing protein n=1 Tax=Candidatus Pseudobacter hemicellulosilyticus TaxID=3121375 RepID=A0AAJ6BG88_9BACT|nr:MAG: DUF5706 domain-containing protein [Pseudobacter sp.]
MTTIEYLEKQYSHAFDMIKFGETKNATLIAFNGAIVIGMAKVANDTSLLILKYFLCYVAAMCIISIFVGFSSLIAKIKDSPGNISLHKNDNMLFFATLAHMTHEELIEKINNKYGCESINTKHEYDLARQVIITSQIAARKFKLFNIAIAFTFCGLLTPLSLIVYKAFMDHDK